MFRKSIVSTAVLAATLGLAACGGGSETIPPQTPVATPPQNVPVGDTIALMNTGRLMSFNRATPGTIVGSVAFLGMTGSETIVGIDIRPANGALYGLGSAGNIYVIEPSSGQVAIVSTLRNVATNTTAFTALAGTNFGLDFNPVADRLRVISNTGQNLRINVDTGDTFVDSPIAPTTAVVTASGYTNAFPGTTSTRLFNLNMTTNTVDLQDPPNNGTQVTGAALGVMVSGINGFDIDARDNFGYAALTVGTTTQTTSLYRVNLSPAVGTNAATIVGAIAGGDQIRALALRQPGVLTVRGLTTDNRLISFDPRTPNTITSNVAITGLAAGENILGMDVRPADGQLWALSSTGRLHILNPTTGAASPQSSLFRDSADAVAPFFAGLDGSASLSVDFNPAVDRMRVISPSGQNLRINVATGATNADLPINRAAAGPAVLAAAYTNNFVGTASTVLYDIDGVSDVLTIQNPPNDGTLTNVGAIGQDLVGFAGFDIAGGDNGLILAALRTGTSGPFSLQTISLTTGAATPYLNASGNAALSQIGGASGPALRDIAIIRP